MPLSGLEKAAMLMLAVKQETAAKVMSLLDDDEIKLISQTMTRLGSVPQSALEQIAREFGSSTGESSLVGNLQSTERFLRQILPKEKVEIILEDIRGPAGRNIWDKLGNVSEESLANYLKNEHPQIVAVILSKLSPELVSKVLSLLNPDFAFEVMKRILIMDPVKPEIIEDLEKSLKTQFISNLSKAQKLNNEQFLAEIFNNFERVSEKKFMSMLEGYNNQASEKVKSLMFTFNDLKRVGSAGIQAVLKTCNKDKLTLALKGAPEEIRKLFIDNMSQRVAKLLVEDLESMPPVKLRDVDQAQAEIISITKTLINKGEIELTNSDDQMVY